MEKITTLVHHIKLNERGWWEKAVQNIIVATIGMSGNCPQRKTDILAAVIAKLENGIDKSRLLKQLDSLIRENRVINVDDDLWVLNEIEFEAYRKAEKDQNEIKINAENRFKKIVARHCTDIDSEKLWEEFQRQMLFPLIKDIGAKTYEFISGRKSIDIFELKSFKDFSKCYNDKKSSIEKIVTEYMNFSDRSTNSFLLILLNEYFFVEATNLDEKTVDEIYKLSKIQQNINIFVDTNFLLTLLDLRDNPSNEATDALIELLKEIGNKIRVRFYILPITIREFQNLIRKFKESIERIKPTVAFTRIVEESTEFSGILKKYFQRCNEANRVIPTDEYFEPYLSNFTVCLREKGIELYNNKFDHYTTDQRVVDDLLSQTEYRLKRKIEKEVNGKNLNAVEIENLKTRIYDKFNHDCQIWHIVKDLRPQYLDSPKDVVNWIMTLDFAFLEYDRYKQKMDGSQNVGICLHPNDLISMLQFWIPRTEKFERAILGNFKLPLLFEEIDTESEKISIEILSSLSQFEGSDKFSKETVAGILTNKALRQKIKPSNSIERNAELIKEEVLKKFDEAQKALAREKATSGGLISELGQVRTQLERVSSELTKFSQRSIADIEEFLKWKQNENTKEILSQREQFREKIGLITDMIDDIEDRKTKADAEVKQKLKSLPAKIKILFGNRVSYRKQLEKEVIPQYYDESKYQELLAKKASCEKDLKFFESIEPQKVPMQDKIIVFCENKNSAILNKLGFKNVSFLPEKNSNGVFIKVRANYDKFGLRDRDYLVDAEIEKIKRMFPNYFILNYYCFENYLYHPENLAELNISGLNVDEYMMEIIRQKNSNKDKIISIYKKSRDSYEEFRIDSEKLRSKNEDEIIDYLKSDDIDTFFKAFSMKDSFDKSVIQKYNFSTEMLSSTNWFKTEFSKIIKIS